MIRTNTCKMGITLGLNKMISRLIYFLVLLVFHSQLSQAQPVYLKDMRERGVDHTFCQLGFDDFNPQLKIIDIEKALPLFAQLESMKTFIREKYFTVGLDERYVSEDQSQYFSEEQSEKVRVHFREGLMYTRSGPDDYKLLNVEDGLYVMDGEGNLYVAENRNQFHHSYILAGRPVAGAGHIMVRKGVPLSMDDSSGHYRPTIGLSAQVLYQLHLEHIDASKIFVLGAKL